MEATEGYAKAIIDASRMQGMGYAVQEHQKVAIQKTGEALEAARPGSTRELSSALRHDPATSKAMAESQGPERAEKLVAGMERERQAQRDTNVRAERFVAQWNGLEAEHAKNRGREQREAREKIETQMRGVAGEIGKDAAAQSVMREKQKDFGIEERSSLGRALREKDVAQALDQRVKHELRHEHERSQSQGYSR